MKTFTVEERVYMLQLYWKYDNDTSRHSKVCRDFVRKYPGRAPPTRQSLRRLNVKFEKTGSVIDQPKTGRPKSVLTLENRELVAQMFVESPDKSKRQAAEELQISTASIARILAMNDQVSNSKNKEKKLSSKNQPKPLPHDNSINNIVNNGNSDIHMVNVATHPPPLPPSTSSAPMMFPNEVGHNWHVTFAHKLYSGSDWGGLKGPHDTINPGVCQRGQ